MDAIQNTHIIHTEYTQNTHGIYTNDTQNTHAAITMTFDSVIALSFVFAQCNSN